jgi:hypothetical protein
MLAATPRARSFRSYKTPAHYALFGTKNPMY